MYIHFIVLKNLKDSFWILFFFFFFFDKIISLCLNCTQAA